MNELSFSLHGETYQEFTQIWSAAYICPESARPCWETNYLHLFYILLISICSVVGIFLPRKIQWQIYLTITTLVATLLLLLSLMVSFRSRQNELGTSLLKALETPHMLWFALLFAFELTILRFLWVEIQQLEKSR